MTFLPKSGESRARDEQDGYEKIPTSLIRQNPLHHQYTASFFLFATLFTLYVFLLAPSTNRHGRIPLLDVCLINTYSRDLRFGVDRRTGADCRCLCLESARTLRPGVFSCATCSTTYADRRIRYKVDGILGLQRTGNERLPLLPGLTVLLSIIIDRAPTMASVFSRGLILMVVKLTRRKLLASDWCGRKII